MLENEEDTQLKKSWTLYKDTKKNILKKLFKKNIKKKTVKNNS